MKCPYCEDGGIDTGGATPWGEPINAPCPVCQFQPETDAFLAEHDQDPELKRVIAFARELERKLRILKRDSEGGGGEERNAAMEACKCVLEILERDVCEYDDVDYAQRTLREVLGVPQDRSPTKAQGGEIEQLKAEVVQAWNAARAANGQTEAFRILERMVDRVGYGRTENNPSLVPPEGRLAALPVGALYGTDEEDLFVLEVLVKKSQLKEGIGASTLGEKIV